MPKTEEEILKLCGKELSLANFDDLAREVYEKMGDLTNVVALYVKSQVSRSLQPYRTRRVARSWAL